LVSRSSRRKSVIGDEIKRSDDGALQFENGKSGAAVTIRSSEVLEISKEEFQKNR
jgi:hypothetical protein